VAVIRPTIETDPAELERIAIDYLRVAMPDWEPADGDLMSWLIAAHARMVAEERDIAADVPVERILRPLGEQVHRILQRPPAPAYVYARVNFLDDAGYTVPAGMEVLVRTSGDDGVTMVVDQTVTVRPSDRKTYADVRLRAAPGREGAEGNGLEHPAVVVPLRALEFISSIQLTSTSAGGYDGESDEQYYQRLVDALALTSQVPVLVEDFAAIARQHPAVGRALAINRQLWRPEVIEVRTTASVATYQLGSGALVRVSPTNDVATVRRAFTDAGFTAVAEAAPGNTGGLASGGIRVALSGRAEYGTWKVSGSGELTIVQLGGERNAVDHAVTVVAVNQEGMPLASTDRASVQAMLEQRRELNWKVSVVNPEYTTVKVTARVVAWPSHDPEAVAASAEAALKAFLSPATWGRGETRLDDGAGVEWIDEPVVRYLEVAQALNEVPGLRYITYLGIAEDSGTLDSRDVPLAGFAALPEVGAISVTVEEG